MDEKLYTLHEARRVLAKAACLANGHTDLQNFYAGGKITMLHCADCGASYDLRERDKE